MAKKIKTASINFKDAQLLERCRKESGYSYATACEIIGKEVLKALGVYGKDAGDFLSKNGTAVKITIDTVHGTGIFEV